MKFNIMNESNRSISQITWQLLNVRELTYHFILLPNKSNECLATSVLIKGSTNKISWNSKMDEIRKD